MYGRGGSDDILMCGNLDPAFVGNHRWRDYGTAVRGANAGAA